MPLELKSTINLPKTDFPMKANLPQNEPKMLARWQEMGLYEHIRRPGRVRQSTPFTTGRLIPAAPFTWAPRSINA